MEDMLRWDPKKRPSAEKALRYPYFQVHLTSFYFLADFLDNFQGTVKQSASHILEQSLQRSHARKKSLPGVSVHLNKGRPFLCFPEPKCLKITFLPDLLGGGG